MRQRFVLLVLLLTMAPPLLHADEPASAVIPGESRPTATRLEEADKHVAEKKFPEAVSLLQSVAESSGKVDRLGDALLARMERGAAVRFRFRWLPGSLQWCVGPLLGAAPAAVELIDAQMGTLVQRINLEEPSLRGTAWLEPGPRSVSPSALVWREAGTAPGVSVWWDGKGLLAGFANRVKALAVDGSQSQK